MDTQNLKKQTKAELLNLIEMQCERINQLQERNANQAKVIEWQAWQLKADKRVFACLDKKETAKNNLLEAMQDEANAAVDTYNELVDLVTELTGRLNEVILGKAKTPKFTISGHTSNDTLIINGKEWVK